jgi:hypothetical protein
MSYAEHVQEHGAEIHLDADEWSMILHGLKSERNRCQDTPGMAQYCKYIDGIVLKIECAIGR